MVFVHIVTYSNHCNRLALALLDEKAWWEGMEMLKIFVYRTVGVVHFTDQNWIPKTVYCIRCVMVCKIGFTNWNANIALLCASMAVPYYIKLFQTRAKLHNSILMSPFLLVTETITVKIEFADLILVFQWSWWASLTHLERMSHL